MLHDSGCYWNCWIFFAFNQAGFLQVSILHSENTNIRLISVSKLPLGVYMGLCFCDRLATTQVVLCLLSIDCWRH